MTAEALTAGVAIVLALSILYLGRRDLSHPAVAFSVLWFGFVALAQLRLTDQETAWGTGFTLLVFGGGLTFVLAAVVAGGTAPVRGALSIGRREYSSRRLLIASLVLLGAGFLGAAWKAHILGDIPLLSGNPDRVRADAVRGGHVNVPTPASALTDGFYLSMWCALVALWLAPRPRSRRRVAALVLLAAVGLFGVALDASRNLVLFSLAVPAIAAYLLAGPRHRRTRLASVGIAVGVAAVVVGGAFVVRLVQAESAGHSYLVAELDRQPAAVRPILPLYINGVFPLEADNRIYHEFPHSQPFGVGAYSLLSLPDAAYPKGKPAYGDTVGSLMASRRVGQVGGGLTWTVATYQGRLYADLGWQGVLLGSALLGLGLGYLYRWARGRSGFLPIAVVGYVTYYAAFMLYDNLLSFTLIAVFDLVMVAVLARYVTGQIDADVSAAGVALRRRAGGAAAAARPTATTPTPGAIARALARLSTRPSLPGALFVAATVLAGLTIFWIGRGGLFHGDDWDMMLYRPDLGAGTLLRPHVDHLIATQVFGFEVLRSVAGWHYGAFRVVMVLLHLAVGTGVFLFARRRVDHWIALAVVLPFLFLGSGYPEFLWAGAMGNTIALASGIGALVLLERVELSRPRRVAACALLSISLASFTWGVAFAVVALVALALPRPTRRIAWVAAGPLLVYAVWRVAHPAHGLTLANVRETPQFVADSAGAAFGALTGLGLSWGRLVAIVAVLGLGRALVASGRRPVFEYAVLALPLAIWTVTGLGRAAPDPTAAASDPKYVYAGVAATLMALAVLLARARLTPVATGSVVVLALTGLLVNIGELGADRSGYQAVSDSARAYIGALEVAQPVTRPEFGVVDAAPGSDLRPIIGTFGAASFQDAVRRVGEEPVDIGVLTRLSPDRRQIVDDVLIRAERLGLAPRPRNGPKRTRCTSSGPGTGSETALPPGGLTVRARRAPADVFVRRYGDLPAARQLGTVPAGAVQELVAPRDRSQRPWRVRIASTGSAQICGD